MLLNTMLLLSGGDFFSRWLEGWNLGGLILVLIGAIVWGMVGIFDFNLVAAIFGAGGTAIVSRIIYGLVGISALWLIFYWILYNPFKSAD